MGLPAGERCFKRAVMMHDHYMAARIRSYRDLLVWQKSMDVASAVLELTNTLNRPQFFALANQLRRSAISTPSNLAEGHGRRSRMDFAKFVSIANGSLREMETQLMLLARQNTECGEEVSRILIQTDEIGRMLNALFKRLRSNSA
jgi:four helix bundle protein